MMVPNMDEERLFAAIKRKTKSVLLDLLKAAFYEMNADQRRHVFGEILKTGKPSKKPGRVVLEEIEAFHEYSLSGHYYAPFDINSKNFSHIPEETEEWFEKLNDLLLLSTELATKGENAFAVKCFSILYELIDELESGEEIVFADELGSWMIPGDEKVYIQAYLCASAKVSTPEEYTNIALPLIERDSYSSFSGKVYSKANKVGNQDQVRFLKRRIKEENIKTR